MTERLATAAPALLFLALMAVSAVWSITYSLRAHRHTRRGVRRLEQYANHQPSRRILDDFHKPRKENPQP